MPGSPESQSNKTQHASPEDTPQDAPGVSPETQERHEKLSNNVNAILDEIDGVLEANAEEFVRAYIQKGGQ